MRWNGFLAATVAALLLLAAPAAANTYRITGTEDIAGSCAGTACSSIRAALSAAAQTDGPDDIQLAAGAYSLTNGALVLNSNVALSGESARTTVLYAAPSSRVIEINGVTASISNMTVSGGVATDVAGYFGGNILAARATVTLDHIRSTGGRAYSGGGIGNRNGTMVISNSLIDHNSAPDGGGDSGGVLNFGGDGLGAANLTITNSTVAFNSARVGGGVMQWGNDQDAMTLQQVTLARNTSTAGNPGGLNVAQGTGHVVGSVIASNQGPLGEMNCAGAGLVSDGYNVDSGTNCNFAQNTDRSDQSPGLDTDLRNYGGQTDALPFSTPSPAENIGGTCAPLDQTGFARSAPCDAGAWEYRVNTKVTLSDPPSGPTNSQTAVFDFDSDAGPDYECRLIRPTAQNPAFSGCDSGITYNDLAEGAYRFEVRPAGAADLSQGDFTTFTVDLTAPTAAITAPAPNAPIGTDPSFSFSSSEPDSAFECSLTQGTPAEWMFCETPTTFHDLQLGHTYTLFVRAVDGANNRGPAVTRTFTVVQDDGIAPVVTISGGPADVSDSSSPSFTFASDDPSATFTCSLDGAAPSPCTSGIAYQLPVGAHTFRVTATDVFGHASSVERTFTIAAPQPIQTPTPIATPTPTATPTPPPVRNQSVDAQAAGTVLVKLKGAKTFVPLGHLVVPNGSEIDARRGSVTITTSTGEEATFSDGLFVVTQSGGMTTLTLSQKLTGCPKARTSVARAAAAKPKTRKLWGDGKGKFRTKGQYSAATVRGTKWLVTDTCTTTTTRVAQGVVSVRDEVKKRTVTLRKGKSYIARAKK